MLNKRLNAPGLSDENFSYARRGRMMLLLVVLNNFFTTLFLSLSHPTLTFLLSLAVVAIRGPTITKKSVGPSVPLSQHLKQDPLTRLYLWTSLPWHHSILHMSC